MKPCFCFVFFPECCIKYNSTYCSCYEYKPGSLYISHPAYLDHCQVQPARIYVQQLPYKRAQRAVSVNAGILQVKKSCFQLTDHLQSLRGYTTLDSHQFCITDSHPSRRKTYKLEKKNILCCFIDSVIMNNLR